MDNHHVYITESSTSCGVIELSRISEDNYKVLFAVASYLYHPARGKPAAFVMWSTLSKDLELYIRKTVLDEELSLTICGPVENPRTSNEIYVFIWEIPHETFKKWYMQARINRIKSQ